MYYRLVSFAGLSTLAEVVPEEPAAPWWPCPRELMEPALPCLGLPCLAWAPGGWDCHADGKVLILPL